MWWKAQKGLKKHKRGEGTRVRLKKCIKPDDKVLSKAEMIRAGRRCAITGITTSGLPSLLFIAPAYTPPGTSTATAYHTITHLRESTNCSSQLLKNSKDYSVNKQLTPHLIHPMLHNNAMQVRCTLSTSYTTAFTLWEKSASTTLCKSALRWF